MSYRLHCGKGFGHPWDPVPWVSMNWPKTSKTLPLHSIKYYNCAQARSNRGGRGGPDPPSFSFGGVGPPQNLKNSKKGFSYFSASKYHKIIKCLVQEISRHFMVYHTLYKENPISKAIRLRKARPFHFHRPWKCKYQKKHRPLNEPFLCPCPTVVPKKGGVPHKT